MIDLAVYNKDGKEVESIEIDTAVLGGRVRHDLLKQAIVMYHSHKRVGTAATKGRSDVVGSGKKMYRQKGTGHARMGNRRTGKRVGGGVTFAKRARDFSLDMPKKQRRLARDSAVLAKLLTDNVVLIDELKFEAPKTVDFARILKNLKIDRSCLVATEQLDKNVYKSARNITKVSAIPVAELNAGGICSHKKLLFTKAAFSTLMNRES